MVALNHFIFFTGSHISTCVDIEFSQGGAVIFTDSNNEINHLRVSGMPESNHKKIYKLLDVKYATVRIHRLVAANLTASNARISAYELPNIISRSFFNTVMFYW